MGVPPVPAVVHPLVVGPVVVGHPTPITAPVVVVVVIVMVLCRKTSKTEVLQMPSALEVNLSQNFSLKN